MKRSLSLVAGVATLLLAGCVSGKKAVSLASYRSGCSPAKIEVVKQDGHDVVLSVCGVHEDWRWQPLSGWEFVGTAAQQPTMEPMDGDADGVPDDVDACPTVAGAASLDAKQNGCPPPADNDNDGVPDAADKCPDQVGVAQADPAKNGCPPDADGDGIADKEDGCPNAAGVANADATKNGCPADQDGDGVPDA